MNKRYLVIAVAAVMVAASVALSVGEPAGPGAQLYTYTGANKDLQLLLVESDIHMSSPLKINGLAIKKYCTFFSDDVIQRSIDYCTSTEILDSGGGFLGNIQMVGTSSTPKYVIAAVQTDRSASQMGDLKTIISTVTETLVCMCWAERAPGGFATVSDWIDSAYEHHRNGSSTTSKSEISGLAGKHLLLEITKNQEGHLWKFVITN